MLGAIIGDIVGSVYEWKDVRTKNFGPLFHPKAFYTDDTLCTVAVADALVHGRDPAESLKDCGRRYCENGGWGGMFSRWLLSDSLEPYGSFGNGAAMRVSSADLLATSPQQAIEFANQVTRVAHNHPEGIKVGEATALAIDLARAGQNASTIRAEDAKRFGYSLDRTPGDIRPTYRFNETCQETVPQALVCALTASDYEDAIRNAISIGDDSDMIAAIAGGVAAALFGIPEDIAHKGWTLLPDDMRAVLQALYREAGVGFADYRKQQ